jgi:hypothetical protein
MRAHALVLATALVLGVLWIGGRLHHENCDHKSNINCSVLWWANGEPPKNNPSGWGA